MSFRRHRHPVNVEHLDAASIGERVADKVAAGIGSWPFLIIQGFLLLGWITANGFWLLHRGEWDPYPFILLNLCLSVQAAYAGPVILLAGNRQAEKDRLTLEHAAMEADKADQQNQAILGEIERNTAATLSIVNHLGIKNG